MKVAAIQMNSQDDKEANVRQAVALIEQAVEAERPDLVVLPETFTFMGGTPDSRRANAEAIPDGPTVKAIAGLAKRLGVHIHAGSLAEAAGDKCYNTTVVFDRNGDQVALYRKIHLFDVVVPGGMAYRESDTMKGGREIVTYDLDGATVGCTICYDLRFPELFRQLRDKGAHIIVVPAAFTLQTGKDHWKVLLQARAIESQCYVVASGQVFSHDGGRKHCYGHSMVIDPWGTVIAECSDKVGHIAATLDLDYLREVRRNIPVAEHRVLA